MTLVEVAIVVALVGVMAALGAPSIGQWFANQRVKAAARSVADAFLVARADAIRTGRAQVVFLAAARASDPPATDPAGTALGAPVVQIDDGPLSGTNCVIDAGELQRRVRAERDVAWGYGPSGGAVAPGDSGGGDLQSGSSFTDGGGNPVTWVMFRPDGLPVTFDASCNRVNVGRGGGAVYLTNGARDYAVVLTPLGGVRVHAWNGGGGAWTN
jgi:type II secretory pathway pseudopilin PulG